MTEDSIIRIHTGDGTEVPLYWYPAAVPRRALLLLPALGIQARLYRELASGLADGGCSVALMEQRGHGMSPVRPGYRQRYSLIDSLDQDMPAALAWLRQSEPAVPLLLGGHSLGGHLSTVYAGQHPQQVDGILHLACAFPHHCDYAPKQRRMLRFLCTLIPLFRLLPGFYPGNLVGFGGRESTAMMMQWRQWALRGDFDIADRRGLAEAVANFNGPVLSVSFERDDFSTKAAVERALSPYRNSPITRVMLGEAEQGQHLGHTGWARAPAGVIGAASRWMESALPSRKGTRPESA